MDVYQGTWSVLCLETNIVICIYSFIVLTKAIAASREALVAVLSTWNLRCTTRRYSMIVAGERALRDNRCQVSSSTQLYEASRQHCHRTHPQQSLRRSGDPSLVAFALFNKFLLPKP
jgi:hypothetical protein